MTDNNENFKVESTPVQNVIALDQSKRASEPLRPSLRPHAVESIEAIALNKAATAMAVNEDEHKSPRTNTSGENWDSDKTEVLPEVDESKAAKGWLVDQDGNIHEMNHFPFVVGRSDSCNLSPSGKGISRRHMEITLQSGRFAVSDLDSVNGVKVNDYQVSRVILEDGDQISIGDCTLKFRFREPSNKGLDPFDSGDSDTPQITTKKSKFGALTGSIRFNVRSAAVALGVLLVGSVLVQSFQSEIYTPLIAVVSPVVTQEAKPVQAQPEAGELKQTQTAVKQFALSQPEREKILLSDVESGTGQIQRGNLDAGAVEKEITPEVVEPEKSMVQPRPIDTVIKRKLDEEKLRRITGQSAEQSAIKKIQNADNLYMQGNAQLVIKELKAIINSALLTNETKRKAENKYTLIVGLYDQYTKGLVAYNNGGKEVSFTEWTKFLNNEKKAYPKERSVYASDVSGKAVEEYLTKAKAAQATGDHHTAYSLWSSAVRMNGSTEAKLALASVDNKVRGLYRGGLKYEYVNSEKAKSMWSEILTLVPKTNEYYAKANAKLSWYQRWGVD